MDETLTCRECDRIISDDPWDDDDSQFTINEGLSGTYDICFACHRDMMERGEHTQCDSCGGYFTNDHLLANPSTGLREICPYCKEVWCE